MSIRVIIADDESLMRSGLRLLLGAADDIDIIAEAAHGAEAIELSRELSPDIILMDIRMPVMDGLEATRTLMAQASHPRGSHPHRLRNRRVRASGTALGSGRLHPQGHSTG